MTAKEILSAFASDGDLAEEVLVHLNMGMWDEWDCDLLTGALQFGFGPPELAIAAKTAASVNFTQGDPNDRQVMDDYEHWHRVCIRVHTKNAGPVKDLEDEASVIRVLADCLQDIIDGWAKFPWIIEAIIEKPRDDG